MASPPTLPPELWLEIFSNAVDVPGLFDTRWDYSPEEQIWEGSTLMRTITQSLATRLAIVYVSRDWWRMGRRFVYETLDISGAVDRQDLENLAIVFEQSNGITESQEEGNREGYGLWVKRIELGSRWFRKDTLPTLVRLIKACHNVRIIFVHGFDVGPDMAFLPQLTDLFESQFAHSLRSLSYWLSDRDIRETPNITNLPKVPLDSATLNMSRPSASHLTVDHLQLPFTTLSCLEIRIPSYADHTVNTLNLPTVPLPALRYLYINGLSDADILPLIPFMEVNGPNLLGIRMRTSTTCHLLPDMLKHGTSIQSLVFDDMDLETFVPEGNPSYPSITHIGLSDISYGRLDDVMRVADGLKYILSRNLFPRLRTVRILATRVPHTLHKAWAKPIALAVKHGICLEDYHRQILHYDSQQPTRSKGEQVD